MRSLIYERARWRKDHEHAVEQGLEDLLFFGCRNEASDYFFKEEWARFEAVGSLKTFVAFSRDQVSIIVPLCPMIYANDLISGRKSMFRIWCANNLLVSIEHLQKRVVWYTFADRLGRCLQPCEKRSLKVYRRKEICRETMPRGIS
jgi:hypothetical protein